jgi:predicted nucleic acid-binding protein
MQIFWDTSAIVALILQEQRTPEAADAWSGTTRAWCWRWMQVEAEAALARRGASPESWAQWRAVAGAFHVLDLEPARLPDLCTFNRALKLRATDAGHLFVFAQAASVVPDLALLSFDGEQTQAARSLGFRLLAPGA